MAKRLLPGVLALMAGIALHAQTPANIRLHAPLPQNGGSEQACNDQYAGTVTLTNFQGQSNDFNPPSTIYLCFGDQFDIVHNGDADLTGDPQPATPPGIGYAFYDCPPTVSGPDLASIVADPCVNQTSPIILGGVPVPQTQGIWVAADQPNGNLTVVNDGTLQEAFNGGTPAPIQFWFAPITIDDFATLGYEQDSGGGPAGPCVNANVAAAFSVVYLNAIEATNINLSGCSGSFQVRGGLPEWDGSAYSISIVHTTDPTLMGTITNGTPNHGDNVAFAVPAPGIYEVTVTDGKSCAAVFTVDMSACTGVTFSLPIVGGQPGDIVCVPMSVSNFTDILSVQFSLSYDPSVVQFLYAQNFNPNMPWLSDANFNDTGDGIAFSWNDLSLNGVTLPDGSVAFELCFQAVGMEGEASPVNFTDQPTPPEVTDISGNVLNFNSQDGVIFLSNSVLGLVVDAVGVTCFGDTDGSFTATAYGGTPPYNLTWELLGSGSPQGPALINTNGGSFTAMNLVPGQYALTLTDAANPPNTLTDTIEIVEPPQVNVIFNENQPACNGQTGSVEAILIRDSVIITNPISQFHFEWNTGDTTTTISNVPSGVYELTVTERSTGCVITGQTFLPQPAPLAISPSVSNASCTGKPDGSVMVSVSGGTAATGTYTFNWPDIPLVVNAPMSNINDIESGTYRLYVSDDNGCTDSALVVIPADTVLSINAVVTPIACNGGSDGSIFVTGTTNPPPGATPYTFTWFPATVNATSTATTSTASGLPAGDYIVRMDDTRGCNVDTTITLEEPPLLEASFIEVVPESCQPGGDGALTVGVSGGVYPYSYAWNFDPALTDSAATNLSGGTYEVTVTDDNGCQTVIDTFITTPVPPVVDSIPTDTVSCPTSTDGALTVFASPGNAPITGYMWSNGGSGPTITDLAPGAYVVSITAADGCVTVDTGYVVVPDPLVIDSIATESPLCPGDGGGTITVFASGGTPPYYFEWSTGLQGQGFAVLSGGNITAGDYSVTITDASGCAPVTADITLEDPPAIVVDFSNIDSVSCFNAMGVPCDGQATATAMYSDGSSGTFTFTWNSPDGTVTGVSSSTATQLCQGMQPVTVSDGVCFVVDSVFIPAPDTLTTGQPTFSERVSCFGASDGSITLTPKGGTPPYTINWDNAMSGSPITGLPAGTYMATITDAKGCTTTVSVPVDEPPPLQIALDPANTQDVTCAGGMDGRIGVFATGGNTDIGTVSYTWDNGLPAQSVVSNLGAGTYSVTATDVKGCTDMLTVTLNEPEPIRFELDSIPPIPCFGDPTYVSVIDASGGNPGDYRFSIDGGIKEPLGAVIPVFGGEHLVEVFDASNCVADTTINLAEPPRLIVEIEEEYVVELGDTLTQLTPFVNLPYDTIIWTPPTGLSCSTCPNPVFRGTEDQQYVITVIDANGCSASATTYVRVDLNRNVYIPNIFSPNNDGINDTFYPSTGLGVRAIRSMRVFDRWGSLVFDMNQSSALEPRWDGTFRGRPVQQGVYVYMIEVEFLDGTILTYRGDVTVVR